MISAACPAFPCSTEVSLTQDLCGRGIKWIKPSGFLFFFFDLQLFKEVNATQINNHQKL